METYDQGPKLGMRCQRSCAGDSATLKGKRPDFMLLSSKALLFKGEDTAYEADLEKALEDLGTKLKDWGAAVHNKVLQANAPYCQAVSHETMLHGLIVQGTIRKLLRTLSTLVLHVSCTLT